jgi:predicted Zn-dependent protease
MQGALARIITTELPRLVISRPVQMDNGMANLLLEMKFSREQEREADEGGVRRLKDAEVEVQGFENLLARLGDGGEFSSLLSDHPSSDTRAELVRRFRGGVARPVLEPGEWGSLKQSCLR